MHDIRPGSLKSLWFSTTVLKKSLSTMCFFLSVLIAFTCVTECSAQANSNTEEQERYYNRAFNSQFGGLKEVSDTEAVELFRRAAESGHAPSQWHLGRMYGEGIGVKKDQEQEVFWKEKAADQRYLSAELDMAEAYIFEEGVERDLKKAFDYLTSASEKGHPRAFVLLANFYGQGVVVELDMEKYHEYFSKSQELYNSDLSFKFSQYGSPVLIAPQIAEQLRQRFVMLVNGFDRKAAEMGNVKQQFQGALFWIQMKDYGKAFQWSWAAAKAGHTRAQVVLGVMAGLSVVNNLSSEENIDIYVACSLVEKKLGMMSASAENNVQKSELEDVRKCIQKFRSELNDDEFRLASQRIENPMPAVYQRINGEFIVKSNN